jgi:putative oxidoreductase
MTRDETMLDRARGWTFALLRIATGLLFVQHGVQKLFGWLGGTQVTDLASKFGVAGVLELVGGTLVALGLFTRPVAFLLAGQMAVAYLTVHAPQDWAPIRNKGELALLYLVLFLFFAAHGAGAFSLDAWRRVRRSSPPAT